MFKNLSYFEMRTEDGEYLSRFPSTKTRAGSECDTHAGKYLFPSLNNCSSISALEYNIIVLTNHLRALSANSFMFTDFYWFVDLQRAGAVISPESIVIDIADLYRWLSNLYIYSGADNYTSVHHTKYIIRSTQDRDFSLECYKTLDSLPQEAIDSIPVCRDAKGLRVVLGRRAANPPVIVKNRVVKNGDEEIVIAGKPGYVLYGEHLLPEKKREIENLYSRFLESGKTSMKISTQDASEALRAIYEEGGLVIEGQVEAYMLKKDDEPGRDLRYWKYGNYGYERVSSSYNILLVIPTIDKLPEPIDTTECQKGVIVTEKVARSEFIVGGKFEPVFPAHVRQLALALDEANKL